MSKNPVFQLSVHLYWTTYLQSIQKALTNDFYYYKTGEIKHDKLVPVLTKLNDYYRLLDTPNVRWERLSSGFSVVVIHMLQVGSGVKFILMAHANKDKTGLFFERETYADARDKSHRINLNECYEFLRINKHDYKFEDKSVDGKNGVWTVGLTEKETKKIELNFETALKKRNYLQLKQICYGLHHLIGFAEVRKDYVNLKNRLESRFAKFHQSFGKSENVVKYANKNYKILSDIYKLPDKIPYLNYRKLEMISIKALILEGLKNGTKTENQNGIEDQKITDEITSNSGKSNESRSSNQEASGSN